tara:strand:+ start:3867 stop:7595 length:3729 start_codon:yes stop_codon:yes gene_type:complete
MLGLQQIVLHNTFITGKTVRLPCAGHTNTSGDNGAGKTSALNLIPIFYGKEPDRLIQRTADKLSFLDFYLPHPSSLIAFEYLREDGPRCAVMYRHSAGTNKLVYRFISASFAESFFMDPIREMLLQGSAVSDVISEIKFLGVGCSKQVDVITEYRAIIQNDKRLLTKGGRNTAAFRRMAQEYCLGHSQARMSHLDEMTTALLKRSEMFGKFKAMISSTMFEDIYMREKPEFRDKTIVDNIRSLNEFRAHQPSIIDCVSTHRERLSTIALIVSNAVNLATRVATEKDVLKALKEQRADNNAKLGVARNEYESEMSELRIELNTAKRLQDTTNDELNDIYEAKDKWDGLDIINKRIQFERLPSLRDQHLRAQETLRLLTEQHSSLENELSHALNKLERQHNKDVTRMMADVSTTRDKRDEANSRYETQRDAIRRSQEDDLEAYATGPDSNRLESLKKKYWVTDAESRSVPITAEDQEEIRRAEMVVEDAELTLDSAEQSFHEAHDVVQQENKLHQQAVDRVDAAAKELRQTEQRCAELRAQVAPDDKTLLAALRREDPAWAESLGRVIQPQLLQRKDLSPVYDASCETVFGWTLDLTKIDTPDFAQSESVLRAKLDKAELDMQNGRGTKDAAEKNAAAALRRLKDAKKKADELQLQAKQAQQHKSEAFADLNQTRSRVKAAQEKRAEAIKAKLSGIESERDSLEAQIKQNLHAIKVRGEEQVQELLSSHSITISELDSKLGALNKEKADLERDFAIDKKRIRDAFDEKYRAEGVDPRTIKAAREDCEQRELLISEVEGYGSLIDRYNDWLKRDWERIGTLSAMLAGAKRDMENAEQQISRKELAYRSLKADLEADIKRTGVRVQELADIIDAADQLLSSIDITFPGGQHQDESDTSTTLLVEKLTNLSSQESELRKRVDQRVQSATGLIQRFSDSRIFNAWEQLIAARKLHSQYDEFSQNFRLEQPDDLLSLLEDQIPQIEEILIEDIRAVGNSIHEYYGTLKLLNSQVSRVTSDLKRKINTNQRISSFSDITVRITSRVEGDDYWQPLVAFNEEWMKWQSEMDRGLPSDSLIDTLKVASDALQEAKISQDVNSLVDMEISMVENDRHIRIRNDRDFNDSSSNGLSFLAICVVFIGMSRYLCPDRTIQLTWPIDELAVLSPNNVARLFAMMKEENIAMFSAFPSADPNMLRHFDNRLSLDRSHGIRLYRAAAEDDVSADDPLLARLSSGLAATVCTIEEGVTHE